MTLKQSSWRQSEVGCSFSITGKEDRSHRRDTQVTNSGGLSLIVSAEVTESCPTFIISPLKSNGADNGVLEMFS